jgi:hypothetical protein
VEVTDLIIIKTGVNAKMKKANATQISDHAHLKILLAHLLEIHTWWPNKVLNVYMTNVKIL